MTCFPSATYAVVRICIFEFSDSHPTRAKIRPLATVMMRMMMLMMVTVMVVMLMMMVTMMTMAMMMVMI